MLKQIARILGSLIITLVFSHASLAQAESERPALTSGLYNGSDLSTATVRDLVATIKPGTILILGEMHGLAPIRDQHMEVLNSLRSVYSGQISVGMEFINYTDQTPLSAYSAGLLTEEDFLKKVNWSGFDFELYRQQILFPSWDLGERVLGINLSRTVTSQIAKGGLGSLTPEQLQLMPPNFTVGRDSYRGRFFAAMGMHPTPKLENYFIAQSAWDDTMAWQTVEFFKKNPEHVFVIIVGEFHAQYGGGLPDHLRARLNAENMDHSIVTLSQIYAEGLTSEEIQNEMQPSVTDCPRGDFIWLTIPVKATDLN